VRAPPTSFRSEIAAYRQKLVADNEGHPLLPRMVKVLNAWEEHGSTEQVWRTIKDKVSPEHMLTEEEFIYFVLQHRFAYLEIANHIVDEMPDMRRKVDHRTKRHMKEGKYAHLASENEILGRTMDLSERLFGREKKTAIRNRFVAALSNNFILVCGQPLDGVVRVLAEVTFGKKITTEAVRGVRK
jgi:hypothetical protein